MCHYHQGWWSCKRNTRLIMILKCKKDSFPASLLSRILSHNYVAFKNVLSQIHLTFPYTQRCTKGTMEQWNESITLSACYLRSYDWITISTVHPIKDNNNTQSDKVIYDCYRSYKPTVMLKSMQTSALEILGKRYAFFKFPTSPPSRLPVELVCVSQIPLPDSSFRASLSL